MSANRAVSNARARIVGRNSDAHCAIFLGGAIRSQALAVAPYAFAAGRLRHRDATVRISLCCPRSGVSFAAMLAPDLIPPAMVISAIGPALLLLWLVVVADSRPEPPRVVLIAVVLGAFSGVAAGAVEVWLRRHLPIAHNPWLAADEIALFIAAIPEEIAKVSVIAAIALRARHFDEPMDGVVYGTAVGLGFAALENLLYVVGAGTHWQAVAAARAACRFTARLAPSPEPTLQAPVLAARWARTRGAAGHVRACFFWRGSFRSSCMLCTTLRPFRCAVPAATPPTQLRALRRSC